MIERTMEEQALPELRFVPVDSLVPHEQHDPTRLEPLVRRILENCLNAEYKRQNLYRQHEKKHHKVHRKSLPHGSVAPMLHRCCSELVRRILLPRDDDEAMPPGDSPPLSAAEIAALEEWVKGLRAE